VLESAREKGAGKEARRERALRAKVHPNGTAIAHDALELRRENAQTVVLGAIERRAPSEQWWMQAFERSVVE
jgi:hypothetical protein